MWTYKVLFSLPLLLLIWQKDYKVVFQDPKLLVFTALCDALHSSVGGTCDFFLISRMVMGCLSHDSMCKMK